MSARTLNQITADSRDRKALRLDAVLKKQAQERGLTPMPLEPETLLRRVRALDWSGEFLGEAFISAYWKDESFNHSLYQLNNLDAGVSQMTGNYPNPTARQTETARMYTYRSMMQVVA